METVWDHLKSICEELYGVDNKVLDYIALNDIFSMAVNGFSNTSIASELEEDYRYIRDSLVQFLLFYGWDNDLDISPMRVYDSCEGNYWEFFSNIRILSPIISKYDINIAYSICKRYSKIREEINKYSDKT